MYVPSILTVPVTATGPIRPDQPDQALTFDWPLLDDGEVQVGVWECTPGTFSGTTGDYDETMFMVSGRVSVGHGAGEYDVAPGTLWATPRNWSSTWTVHQTVRKMYVIDQRRGDAADPAHLANAYTAPLGEAVPRPNAISGRPMESSRDLWARNRITTGVWECTPGEFAFRRDGYDEVFCVLSGRATLHVDGPAGGGQSFTLVPGTVLLTPAGLTGRWVVHDTLRKVYTIIHR